MTKEQREKQIKKYLFYDRHLNSLDLELWQQDNYFSDVEGRTEQEKVLLGFLEKEIHELQHTIEYLKNEFEENRFKLEEEKEED